MDHAGDLGLHLVFRPSLLHLNEFSLYSLSPFFLAKSAPFLSHPSLSSEASHFLLSLYPLFDWVVVVGLVDSDLVVGCCSGGRSLIGMLWLG